MEFLLRPAVPGDLGGILDVMESARQILDCQEWFVPDDEAYFASHIDSEEGFACGRSPGGELAAYLPSAGGEAPDALGRRLGMESTQLHACAQMDSCCVAPPYRGNSLEGRLMELAEQRLQNWPGKPYIHCLGTVHPDNAASLYSFFEPGVPHCCRRCAVLRRQAAPYPAKRPVIDR